MTFRDLYDRYQNLVAAIANEYGRKGYTFGADSNDFGQEFYLWIVANQERLAEKFEELGEERFEKYLARCLRNEGKDYLVDIKAQSLGYERRDLAWYTVNELKKLLDCVFDEQAWHEPPKSDGRSTKAPAEGGNWITTLADVAGALKKIPTVDQELLRDLHERGWTNGELADLHNVSDQVMSYRHGAACKRLLEQLGGERPAPMRQSATDPAWRGRRAVTNAAARAMTSSDYEED